MIKDLEQFNNLMLTNRNAGRVTCSFKDINTSENEKTKTKTKTKTNGKELFLKELGFKSNRIEGNWKPIYLSMAKKILEYILSLDMAYDLDLGTKPLADKLSAYFLNQFQSDTKYYTNGIFDEDLGFFRLRSWLPVTDSTFDTGVLAIYKNRIGILWAEDND
jgi:hypothetical protein